MWRHRSKGAVIIGNCLDWGFDERHALGPLNSLLLESRTAELTEVLAS
ncbi:hypothetical protein ABIB14_001936 [Arthrobacter sp. UYEF3]